MPAASVGSYEDGMTEMVWMRGLGTSNPLTVTC